MWKTSGCHFLVFRICFPTLYSANKPTGFFTFRQLSAGNFNYIGNMVYFGLSKAHERTLVKPLGWCSSLSVPPFSVSHNDGLSAPVVSKPRFGLCLGYTRLLKNTQFRLQERRRTQARFLWIGGRGSPVEFAYRLRYSLTYILLQKTIMYSTTDQARQHDLGDYYKLNSKVN